MTVLNLPSFDYKIKKEKDRLFIFDIIRKRYIALTPEEWVRQHFVSYLISYKGYPLGLIGNEISLRLNGQNRRCDTVIYDIYGSPLMIIEYKAPHITLNQEVFDQVIRYNIALKVKYLVVSNGINHYCCVMDYDDMCPHFLKEIPDYNEL
ncbi:type I restriction enzyme HsdR N-terminal domain-containing protein [Coprobacter secundus]|uniref:Type I restriction enzyme R protein N-terminal domain-containing protein n=1 Tax=Coprobacter secundus subsp. similis TaxID=2751153 RepID=A0A7G1HVM1_9BACT|nr:type I restriction enzyme HsdR N-terminal domain-containing protein [Coprobacter secundus]BCI62228.1 hypothetical protein Cop2CBH44_05810 [Coprobacter secundus subsp. similis]CCY35459.1 putative uncharacterized protein [Tannerella sp. CAG:118]